MEIKNGHSGRAQDKTIINRIMQRFRPIAPKPVTEGSDVASVVTELVSNQKAKRKYVRVKKNSKSKIIKAEGKGDRVFDGAVNGFLSPSGVSGSKENGSFTVWSFTPAELQPSINLFPTKSVDEHMVTYSVRNRSDLAAGTPSRKVVESWLVVDGMTETCLELGELGSTDTDKMRNLELDTCPGLISDSEHRVQWMNHAFKKMVDIDEEEGKFPVEVVVWLVLGQKIPDTCQVFTCNVRVIYTWRKEKHSQTMPCDVWRMDFGGFAWRLDATAALKLGR